MKNDASCLKIDTTYIVDVWGQSNSWPVLFYHVF